MKRIVIDDLPAEPLAAASVFYQHWLPHAERVISEGDDVMLVFAPADHTHRAWRCAAIQELARQSVPRRANAVAGEGAGIDAFAEYLTRAPGVTGQYFEEDDRGAGNPAQ